jgi:hypothetical protein
VGANLQINSASVVSGMRPGNTAQAQTGYDAERISKLYRETAIASEIASKASKLPDPDVWVDPKAIARMAEDPRFYDKVMSKINDFTGNPDIAMNYPYITYSLAVDEDGEWTETMVDEVLKKRSEKAEENDRKSIFEMLAIDSPSSAAARYNPLTDVMYDYRSIPVDVRRRIER